jgi:hypothetical protein
MNYEILLSTKELHLKEEDTPPYVEKILDLFAGCNIDQSLQILQATRQIIVKATNPKVIDSKILSDAKILLKDMPSLYF